MVTRRKPRVAIIHSHSSKRSRTGEDLSVFLAVCLQLGGYSDVRIVAFSGENVTATAKGAPQKRLSVVPYGRSEVTFPNHCECYRDDWSSLEECNMFLLCVDPPDAEACAAALSLVVKAKDDVAVVSFDLGLRNFSLVANHLGGHKIVLLSGAVGISLTVHPRDKSLRCLGRGSLVVERLSKEQSKKGLKFVNLLRTGGIPVRHCKNVACYSHGAAIFKTCHAAAALAGVSLQEFVQDPYGRSLWAAMIREGLYALSFAARGGDWRAANPCCSLTLPQLELCLCLPPSVFKVVSRWILSFPPDLAPPTRLDLDIGRETGVAWTLAEIVRVAEKHKVHARASRAVLSAVMLAVRVGDGAPHRTPQSVLIDAYGSAVIPSDSARDLRQKVVRWCVYFAVGTTVLGVLAGIWFAVTAALAVLLAAVIKYAVIGDVVP